MLWNAYTWVLISTILAALFIKPTRKSMQVTLSKWMMRAFRLTFSRRCFLWDCLCDEQFRHAECRTGLEGHRSSSNMIYVLSEASAKVFADFIPLLAATLASSEDF